MGSSPLARGLLGLLSGYAADRRIIPARAGFTSPSRRRRRLVSDHPRSRGVYIRIMQNHRRCRRIIPARAGFTSHRSFTVRGEWDHPRSRGVYVNRIKTDSSIVGIIPARAGFTSPCDAEYMFCRDHPRSRGVYQLPVRSLLEFSGSSPLARGLPDVLLADATDLRIIPARAGFTDTHQYRYARSSDHPRSRGVYAPRSDPSEFRWGSSPLARGLPFPNTPSRNPSRIIPARAGFTDTHQYRYARSSDHPRSRGVYGENVVDVTHPMGSSPLARGLRAAVGYSLRLPGIIPARAGFTKTKTPPHTPPTGSSPLARGLRRQNIHNRRPNRNIPARAGFTQPQSRKDV